MTTSFGLLESRTASFVIVLCAPPRAGDSCAAIGSAAGSASNNVIAKILFARQKNLVSPASILNSSRRTWQSTIQMLLHGCIGRSAAAMIGLRELMRIVEKSQLMSASEIDRTVQRLAHEIVEKSGG